MPSPLIPSPSEIQYQLAHTSDNRSSQILISHYICLPLATLAVILRLVSRYLCKAARLQADDYLVIAAWILASAQVAVGLLCVHYGGGKHAILLSHPQTFGKIVLAHLILYNPAIALAKISILVLYRRIFPSPRLLIVLWAVGAFVVCYCTAQFFVLLIQCRPIRAAWDPTVPDPTCIRVNTTYIVIGSFNAFTDIVTLCIPMPMLWRLQISRERKAQLMSMFMLGGFVCVVSIYRVPKMYSISLSDVSWSDVEPCVWSVVEVDVAIICACLPTFRPLFDQRVRRGSKRGQSVELVTENSFASPKRRSGYENVDGKGNNKFLDLVRKNWAVVPSARNSLEWKTSPTGHYAAEEGRRGAKAPSLAVEECRDEEEVVRGKAGDDVISKARCNSEGAAFGGGLIRNDHAR